MRVSAIVFLLSACVCGLARAERCPSQNQPAEVPAHLNGTLTYHPGVYAWYRLEVSPKVCGERVVQLGFVDNALAREAHRYVGCRVSVSGNLIVPFTGYWSARLGLGEAKLGPVTGCRTGDPLPDYSQVKISPSLKAYRVLAQYDPSTTIFQARVVDAATGASLTPWQAYVSDTGNGARDLQRMFCAQGFTASFPEKSKAENVSEGAADGIPAAIEVQLPDDGKPLTVPFLCTRTAK